MANSSEFGGKVALVVGATSGIGAAVAVALADHGAHVVVAGRRAERGAQVVAGIADVGGSAEFEMCDVTEEDDPRALVDLIVERHGSLDIAVNSAGIFDRDASFHDYGDPAWDAMIATNLTGVFRCMRAELAAMVVGGGGSIVNIGSTAGHVGSLRASPAYIAAKHGLMGLTRQAAIEYAGRRIRVNAVSPGPTATEIAAPLIAEGDAAVGEALGTLTPLARFVEVDEVAAAVVHLCSFGGRSINGQDVVIDGGQLAGM